MNTKKSYLGKALLFAIIGLIFILIPALVSKYIMLFIGLTIIVYGIISLLTSINLGIAYKTKLSIFICILGLLFILLAKFILSLIGIIFAIYCFIKGFSAVGLGLRRKEMKLPYIFQLIKGFITLVVSVLFFVLPSAVIHIQIMVLGAYFLFSALTQIYNAFTSNDQESDFIHFYFNKNDNTKNEVNNDDGSIIDVEASIKEEDK